MSTTCSPEAWHRMAGLALARWQDDPVLFAREVLCIEPWDRQRALLYAIRDHNRVAIKSCHKSGKTTAAAMAAIWWACTRPRARVVCTSASYRQVKEVLFHEIRRLYKGARFPLGGEFHANPESGWQIRDGRSVVGFSTTEPERFAGFSGPNMLFICDEASGVEDRIFDAIFGNMAGGGKCLMASNPTRLSGEFHAAFTSKAEFWKTMTISALDVPAGIPGLATQAWCEEKRKEWGDDSALYAVRVLGEFPKQGSDAVIPLSLTEAATARWPNTVAEGPLHIGVDVARYGGDASCIMWRRGHWASKPLVLMGLDVVEVSGEVLKVVREHGRAGERASVKVDSAVMGAGVVDILSRTEGIDVLAVSSSSASPAPGYSRMRDACWYGMRNWLDEGGAIAPDDKLIADLIAPTYGFDPAGRVKVESKEDMRRRIGRSTDRADALALAIFEGAKTEWDPIVVRASSRGQ